MQQIEGNIAENSKEARARRRKAKKIKLLIRLAIFIIFCLVVIILLKGRIFNVKEYRIEGNVYYTDDEVMTMADCKTGGNIFIGTDYKDMSERLGREPYFEEIKISKELPATVLIEVKERSQAAALVYGNNFIIIDEDGIVLRKTSKEPEVPIIRGLSLTAISLGEKTEVEEEMLFDEALDIINTMNEKDMYFKDLVMSKGDISCYVLDNLIVEGKPTDILNALKAGEIQAAVSELFSRDIERGVISVSGSDFITFSPRVD